VRHLRLGRVLTGSVLVVSASAGAFALSAGPASAVPPKIVCKALSGAINGNITLSQCSGNTGGSSMPFLATSLATGGTIPWTNGKTTTITLTSSGNETDADAACPAAEPTEFEAKGSVTADTTGSAPVGGVAKGEACVNSSTNAIVIEPGSKLKLK
jgi:hypothetical protein